MSVPSEALTPPALLRPAGGEFFGGLPSEALTPLAPLSLWERGEKSLLRQSFSLLSPRERRAGVVRASEGTPSTISQALWERGVRGVRASKGMPADHGREVA